MSVGNTKAPNLPQAPADYDKAYLDQLLYALRLYFASIDNPGPSVMATQRNGTDVKAALNFSQYLHGTQTASVPTQADLAHLRVGDVYADTSAGNVLKIKI